MANTYTQIHIQAIFAVQNRQSFVDEYLHLLKEFEVDFDEPYIFKPVL